MPADADNLRAELGREPLRLATLAARSVRGNGAIGTENAAGRNGLPNNIRIFRGDSNGWNPTISYGAGSSSSQRIVLDGYGTGNAAKCGTITSSDLLTGFAGTVPKVGCVPIA